jgi:hypothetical protein
MGDSMRELRQCRYVFLRRMAVVENSSQIFLTPRYAFCQNMGRYRLLCVEIYYQKLKIYKWEYTRIISLNVERYDFFDINLNVLRILLLKNNNLATSMITRMTR